MPPRKKPTNFQTGANSLNGPQINKNGLSLRFFFVYSKQSHRRSDVSVLTEDMITKVVCPEKSNKTFGNESEAQKTNLWLKFCVLRFQRRESILAMGGPVAKLLNFVSDRVTKNG